MPKNKNAKTLNKGIVLDLHDECENVTKKSSTEKTKEPSVRNASIDDTVAKTAGSGNQRRNRRNRRRGQKYKEDEKNETLYGCADVGSTKRASQHTEKQKQAKNPKAPIQNTQMQDLIATSPPSAKWWTSKR